MNINDLLKMQSSLEDIMLDRILHEQRIIVPEKEQVNSALLSLASEVGELANEIASFKFWKQNHVRNDKKILEEYADCLFSLLNIANLLKYTSQDIEEAYMAKWRINLERQKNNY